MVDWRRGELVPVARVDADGISLVPVLVATTRSRSTADAGELAAWRREILATTSVGHSIFEMRIDYGPAYGIYYVHRGAQIVILLCSGDKRATEGY